MWCIFEIGLTNQTTADGTHTADLAEVDTNADTARSEHKDISEEAKGIYWVP